MTVFALDTFAAINRLKDAGFTELQAKEIVQIFKDADTSDLATKSDLRELKAEVFSEIKLQRWMLGVSIAGTMSLVIHTFFH